MGGGTNVVLANSSLKRERKFQSVGSICCAEKKIWTSAQRSFYFSKLGRSGATPYDFRNKQCKARRKIDWNSMSNQQWQTYKFPFFPFLEKKKPRLGQEKKETRKKRRLSPESSRSPLEGRSAPGPRRGYLFASRRSRVSKKAQSCSVN